MLYCTLLSPDFMSYFCFILRITMCEFGWLVRLTFTCEHKCYTFQRNPFVRRNKCHFYLARNLKCRQFSFIFIFFLYLFAALSRALQKKAQQQHRKCCDWIVDLVNSTQFTEYLCNRLATKQYAHAPALCKAAFHGIFEASS